eukprot:1288375-Prymnesium_polylepis.1
MLGLVSSVKIVSRSIRFLELRRLGVEGTCFDETLDEELLQLGRTSIGREAGWAGDPRCGFSHKP